MNKLKKRISDSHRFGRRGIFWREAMLVVSAGASTYVGISLWNKLDSADLVLVLIAVSMFPVVVYGNLIRHSELFVPKSMRTSIEVRSSEVIMRLPGARSQWYFGPFFVITACFVVLAFSSDFLDGTHRGSAKIWAILLIPAAIVLFPVAVQRRVLIFRWNAVEAFNYLPWRDIRVLVEPAGDIRVGATRSVLGDLSARWIAPRPNTVPIKQEAAFIHIEIAVANSSYYPEALEDIARMTGIPVSVRD